MKKSLVVSTTLHSFVFLGVLFLPRTSSKWDRVDAIPVDLVASVASTKAIAPPAPAQEQVVPPEPEKPKVEEPKPPKKEPAPKPAKRTQTRRFQRIGSTPSNEPTLEERLKERFENIDSEDAGEEETEASEPPPPAPSAPSTGVTNIATVEATDFPYAWYLNLLRTKITEAWDPPASRLLAGRPNQVMIKFFLARDGTASELEVDVVSGAPGLESSARRAVQRAQPFPPLPEGYPEDSVVIAVRFTVSEKMR